MTHSKMFLMVALSVAATACSDAPQTQTAPAEYEGYTVKAQDQDLVESYSATIRGRQDVSVMPQVSGTLTKLLVKEGDRVRNGQVLFVIDQVPYRAALETAKANVEAAQAQVDQAQLTYDSRKTLREKNVVSDYDLATAENSLLSAKAALAQANAQLVNATNSLSYTEVKSPSDGVVGVLPFRVGALVSPSMQIPLTTVSDNSSMYVYFSLNENAVLALTRKYGSREKAIAQMPQVELTLSDGSTYERKGKVETISGVVDQNTGTAQLRAIFENPEGFLLSGTSGTISIVDTKKNALVIPQTATFEIQDKVYVYKVIDGKATSQMVSVSRVNDGKSYVVNSGLAEGDVIVASGVGLLREGTAVAIKNNEAL